jgi:protein transport protein SEC31
LFSSAISLLIASRFNDIAWSQPSEQHPRGIIAGALDSGALVLWDAEKLCTGAR